MFAREYAERNIIQVLWIGTADQRADLMTKLLTKHLTQKHSQSLGIRQGSLGGYDNAANTATEELRLRLVTRERQKWLGNCIPVTNYANSLIASIGSLGKTLFSNEIPCDWKLIREKGKAVRWGV